ncbi:anthrone oxygenase family protein [Olivibacter sp. CPCC 100613]|uniref:anthrone oxygenase family protein n=1 Tax=Olivibacter sp. CPCC 100613 TaxID=3079931 RepID=UPI002FF682C6
MYYLLTLVTLLTTALMSGLFFTWSNAIMPGLKKLPAFESLLAMQSFNKSILNPWFLTAFLLPVILLPLKAVFVYKQGLQLKLFLLVLAMLLYFLGVFMVTIVINVPINEGLNKIDLQQLSMQELIRQKDIFQTKWVFFNTIRAICATLSFLLLIVTVIDKDV